MLGGGGDLCCEDPIPPVPCQAHLRSSFDSPSRPRRIVPDRFAPQFHDRMERDIVDDLTGSLSFRGLVVVVGREEILAMYRCSVWIGFPIFECLHST